MLSFLQSYKKLTFVSLLTALFLCGPGFAAAAGNSIDEIGTTEWVRHKTAQYPELTWLWDTAVQATQEGQSAVHEHSWSQKIKGAHYPEFERSMLSLVSLHLIADGSDAAYERFTKPQAAHEKLSRESFQRLHEFAQSVIKGNAHTLKLLEVNLVLGDTGKTPHARGLARPHGITEPDHDLFLDECLEKCSDIFSTFKNLSPEDRANIQGVTGKIHFGHLSHVEGGPNMLRKLKSSGILSTDPRGFDFEVLTHICDVSAALGHMDNQGSKVMTENTFRALEAVKDTLQYLAHHTEAEALQKYLDTRAKWLGLNTAHEGWQILARIGCMMRLFDEKDGAPLQASFAELDKDAKVLIISQLNPLEDRREKTPTYVPAVLVNLLGTLQKAGLSREAAIGRTVTEGVPLMAYILGQYRTGKANQPYSADMTLNFNTVAGQLRDKPDLATSRAFSIDAKGNVKLEG